MSAIRRSAGFGALLLSIIGLLLCAAGVISVWICKSRADTVTAAAFGTADEAFVFLEDKLARVNQTLSSSRQRVNGMAGLAERLKTTGADLSTEIEPLQQTLDDVYDELRSAEHWLDSCQAIAGGVHSVSAAIVASEENATRNESTNVTAAKVAKFSAEVSDALAKLQIMRQELVNLRDKKTLAREFAVGMTARVTEFDAKLVNVSTKIEVFSTQVSKARAACVALGRRVHWWIAFATTMLMLACVWLGVSQIAMIYFAWHFARRSVSKAGPS